MQDTYANQLHEFIEVWLKQRRITWGALLTEAGLGASISTDIWKGTIPRPANLRKLAGGMGVTKRRLFELAEYIDPAEFDAPVMSPEEEDVLLA